MADFWPLTLPGNPKLTLNITHFTQALRVPRVPRVLWVLWVPRAGGMPGGTGKTIQACRAIATTGSSNKSDLYWALYAVLDTCLWYLEYMMAMILPVKPLVSGRFQSTPQGKTPDWPRTLRKALRKALCSGDEVHGFVRKARRIRRDVGTALAAAGGEVQDWQGGARA